MKIDELPIEMLMTIFSHLRTLKNVSLVNWKFYDAACKLSDPRMCLELFPPYPVDDAENALKYIRKTTRKIANLAIKMGPATKEMCVPIASITENFSPNIKKLTIRGAFQCKFRFSDILDILSMASNAQFIEFRSVQILEDHGGSQSSLQNVTNEVLNLTKLKTLKIKYCSRGVAAIFNRLPGNVLTELVLHDHDLVELNDLFKRQGTIKTLTIRHYYRSLSQRTSPVVPVDIFDNQKLEALRCTLSTFDNSNFELILSKQKNLKRLEVSSVEFGDGFMNAVMNHLTELETLRTLRSNWTETGWTILKNIKNLKKLKYLQLELYSDEELVTHIEEFATFDHSSITTLRIHLDDIPRHVLVAVARSVRNLKFLEFVYEGGDDLDTTLNMIMEIFNFVERLSFTGGYRSYNGSLSQRNSANPKLIELNIEREFLVDTKFLVTLIECYPNLKRLSLRLDDFTVPTFKYILNGFKKLESMTLEVLKQTSAINENAFLDCLREYGKNLKFVEIFDMVKWKPSAEIKAKLTAIYEVVEFDVWGTLSLGVDRKLIEERESESTYKSDLGLL